MRMVTQKIYKKISYNNSQITKIIINYPITNHTIKVKTITTNKYCKIRAAIATMPDISFYAR